jgi:CRP-like cAMP-binding protein/CheY-like chemotaxis protein
MKKVLLIEDDTILREGTAELLEFYKYQVIRASNGRVGIKKAKNSIPDIIVCDIMMPEIDGYTVLEILSKDPQTKYIPFIFISAKTDRKDVRKGMELGADDYIPKPFSEDELISAIESRLAKTAILKDMIENNGYTSNNEDKIITINDLKNFFDDHGESFFYNEDDIIYNEGNHSNYIYLIKKGVVKCYKFDELGKELITALYKEDDFFGFTAFMQYVPSQETATAIKDAELLGISKSQFKNILENNHKVSVEIIQLLSDNLSGANNKLLNMAYSSVIKKTANTILKFAEKMNKKPEDSIKISRSDLASVAGIATETFIRTMSNFKKEGLIEIEGRNIRILDIEKLKNIH